MHQLIILTRKFHKTNQCKREFLIEKKELEEDINNITVKKNNLDIELQSVLSKLEKYKLLNQKQQQAKSRRENNPTTWENITSVQNTSRYDRQRKTKDILEYIHRGMEGALLGAWDFLTRYGNKDQIEKYFLSYKRGKFVETLYGNFSDTFTKSPASMNQAVAMKYAGYLSRRKFDFFCKIQKLTFDPENQKWCQKEIEY